MSPHLFPGGYIAGIQFANLTVIYRSLISVMGSFRFLAGRYTQLYVSLWLVISHSEKGGDM